MNRSTSHVRGNGFSLLEVMVALTIGVVMLLGLSTLFINSSSSRQELERSGQLIENGRYAINSLFEDIRHAGFFGHYSNTSIGGVLPDPCEISSAANLQNGLRFPIQGYRSSAIDQRPDLSATSCDNTQSLIEGNAALSLLTTANLLPGSDVVVVRRAETVAATNATLVVNDAYLQSNPSLARVYFAANGVDLAATAADGTTLAVTNRAGGAAPLYKYLVHVYFVAPCSRGSATGGVCQSGDDSVPTLKRLELSVAGGTRTMVITPLVEGVEYLKLGYGIDNSPATVNSSTGSIGDGVADLYTSTPAANQWSSVVSARVAMLLRNLDATRDHSDSKSYTVGELSVPATNDQFKRHLFESEIRLTNQAGRREVPGSFI
jgi:type IV pilus assembly protein PilW